MKKYSVVMVKLYRYKRHNGDEETIVIFPFVPAKVDGHTIELKKGEKQ